MDQWQGRIRYLVTLSWGRKVGKLTLCCGEWRGQHRSDQDKHQDDWRHGPEEDIHEHPRLEAQLQAPQGQSVQEEDRGVEDRAGMELAGCEHSNPTQ